MANRAFFRSSRVELAVAMTLQAIGRSGSRPVWGEGPAASRVVGELDPAREAFQRGPAPLQDSQSGPRDETPSGRLEGNDVPVRTQVDESTPQAGSSQGRHSSRVECARRAEHELLRRLLQGDSRAWQEFEQRYSRLIQSCIRRVTAQFPAVGPEDVREIQAMLWVQLLANDRRKLRGFEPDKGCALSSWIGMLAVHCTYDYLRALRREPVRVALADAGRLSSELPSPADQCAARENARRLEAALNGFSARDREFVRLYFDEGLEAEEIAGQLGISVKTVYSKKHKIRLRLESAMAHWPMAA